MWRPKITRNYKTKSSADAEGPRDVPQIQNIALKVRAF